MCTLDADLLEAEKLEDVRRHRRVEAEAALVGAQRAVELHAPAAVVLERARGVAPRHAELEQPLGLDHGREAAPVAVRLGAGALEDGRERLGALLDGLEERRLVRVLLGEDRHRFLRGGHRVDAGAGACAESGDGVGVRMARGRVGGGARARREDIVGVGDDRRRRAAGGRSTASPVAGRATGGLVGLGGTARASASPRAMVGDARSGFARVLVPGRSLQFLAGERRSFAVDAHTRRARAFDFVDAVQRALRLGLRGLGDGVSRRRECALRFETRVLEHELSATRTPARCPTRAAPPRSTRRASLPRRRRSCRRLCRWAARTRRTSSSRARTCGPWASPPRTRRGARGVLKCRRAPRRCRRGRATARGAAPGRGRAAPWSVG